MHSKVKISSCLLLTLLLSLEAAGQNVKLKETLRIEGRVVAYDSLASLGGAVGTRTQILVARVDTIRKGKERSEYLILNYLHPLETPAPPDFFDGKLVWQFRLVRANYCDGKLSDINYLSAQNEDGTKYKTSIKRLKATKGAEHESPPTDSVLPCYLLLNNYRIVK